MKDCIFRAVFNKQFHWTIVGTGAFYACLFMRYALTHFLTFSPETVTEEVYWALAGIYAVLVVVSASSIISLDANFMAKLAWIVLITVLPVIGMALYCIRCLIAVDYSLAKQFGFGFRKQHQIKKSNVAKSTTAMLK